MALFGCMNVVKAEDAPAGLITIPDGIIQKEGYGYVSVMVNNLPEKAYNGFEIHLNSESLTQAGLTFADIQIVDDETGYHGPDAEVQGNKGIIFSVKGTEQSESGANTGNKETSMFRPGDYQLCKLVFKAASTITASNVEITIDEIDLSGADGKNYTVNIPSLKLKVTDARRVLDENSTNSPMNTPGTTDKENILVKRSFKADNWSTLCMPFPLSKTNLDNIFGDNFTIATFGANVTCVNNEIRLKFSTITDAQLEATDGIEANRLYLIKTTKNINEFELKKHVDHQKPKSTLKYKYDPDDEDIYMPIDFVGVYYKQDIPDKGVFISGNKFYYSTGKSTIKGYRGYFVLDEGIQDIVFGDSSSELNISLTIDGELTAVEGLTTNNYLDNDNVYSVSGVYMGKASDMKKLARGMYIVNGKKVIVK